MNTSDPHLGARAPRSESTTEAVTRIPADPWPRLSVSLRPGDALGSYKIIGLLGAGGMGVVYRARQEKPARDVALKVVRPGFVSAAALRRFEFEAEVLGRLQHPGIAQIFEAGSVEAIGSIQQYFAMELVSGSPLKEFVRSTCSVVTAILELFARTVDAVHYAHTRGVIHRDLKPSNILVTLDGQPKVLDFGIARLIDRDSVQHGAMQTELGQIIGTLPYMSPEQVGGRTDDIDHRTDVYSLGVVLYELLTNAMPIDLRDKSLPQAARMICESEPRRPSELLRRLDRDVETIVLKALEKDRGRRYQSAGELAEDVRRFLRNEPVRARPPTTLYQVRKFSQRNRALVGGIAATMTALTAGLVGTTAFAIIARERSREARRQAELAGAVNEFVKQDLLLAATPEDLGINVSMQSVLDNAARRVGDRFRGEPLAQAAVRRAIGTAYARLGAVEEARQQLSAALDVFRSVGRSRFEEAEDTALELCEALWRTNDFDQAERLCEWVASDRESRLGGDEPRTLFALNMLAGSRKYLGDLSGARALYERVFAARKRVLGPEHEDTLNTMHNLGLLHLKQAQAAAAEGRDEARRAELDRALDYVEGAYHARVAQFGPDARDSLLSASELASLLRRSRQFDEARALYEETLERMSRVLGIRNWRTLELRANFGILMYQQRRLLDALYYLAPVVEDYRAVRGPTHPDTLVMSRYYADTLVALGEQAAAQAVLCRATDDCLRSGRPDMAPRSDLVATR